MESIGYLRKITEEGKRSWKGLRGPQESEFRAFGLAIRNLPEGFMEERTGGVMAVAVRGNKFCTGPFVKVIGEVGQTDSEYGLKVVKYTIYALSKLAVLVSNPDLDVSAQNSELPESERCYILPRNDGTCGLNDNRLVPGGAIAVGSNRGRIFSFSGLPSAKKDECLSMGYSLITGQANMRELNGLASRIGNGEWPKVGNIFYAFSINHQD